MTVRNPSPSKSYTRWEKFLIAGGVCFFTNLMVLYIATEIFGLNYLLSMLISIMIVNTQGWLMNRTWTFQSSEKHMLAEYLRYLSANLGSNAASLGAMAILVSLIGINYLAASALIAIFMIFINFYLHSTWTFKTGNHRPRE